MAVHQRRGGGITPLCDIPSGCCFFTVPWTVTRSSLRMLRRVPLPSLQTKVITVGKNEIYKRENLVGPFLVLKLLGPRLPSPPF